ncbi:MAG TPA: FTR1 family protein [Candidatus Nitrosotenuis sp.]|nr:FTR1 family protein [Candidatus Nitrosotenuis sp.]
MKILLGLAPLAVIAAMLLAPSYADSHDAASIQATGEVVKIGTDLVKSSIANGDIETAKKYSKFTTDYYSSRLSMLREENISFADDLHLSLLDIHAKIESDVQSEEILQSITNAEQYFGEFPQSQEPNLVMSELLNTADDLYQKAASQNDNQYYTISALMVDRVIQISNSSTTSDERENEELNSFFSDLKLKMDQKNDFVSTGKLITTIQRDLTGTDSISANQESLYDVIRQLYAKTISEVQNGNYENAEELAITTYLDNFEYLESDIEKADASLLHTMEINMREKLRSMIHQKESSEEIGAFINDPILKDLDKAEAMTSKSPNSKTIGVEALAQPTKSLGVMGTATEDQKTGVRNDIDIIRANLQIMLEQYREGEYQAAYASARTAYLDSYEHVEIPLRAIDPDFTLEVELQFSELRNMINDKADYDKIEETTIAIRRNLDESERLVTGTGQLAPAIAFTSSFSVIFREGLESVLILGAILTYLEASRNTRFKKYVHYGILLAISATGVTWLAASYLIRISGANRDLIEAFAALSATAVLFYVSFWILNKIEHKRWMEFVKAKVWQASATGGTIVFVMLSFFTVYREGFETVLFYEAMLGFAKYMESYVILGFVVGMGSLFAVYFITRKIGKRLPLKLLFALTMGVGAYLSIAFLGNAVRELQTLDIIPFTSLLGTVPRLDINMAKMTGIYPTLESVASQVLLLAVYLVAASFVLIIKPRKEAKIASMRKSRKEVDEFETH